MNGKIPFILEGGKCTAGIESTIIGFSNQMPVIYRSGSITVGEIEEIAGPVFINSDTTQTLAPGMLKKHYSPRTPLVLTQNIEAELNEYEGKNIGLLTYDAYSDLLAEDRQILLGKTTNMHVIAHNLYAAMHTMDDAGYDVIIVRRLPDEGIGDSINDRLTRASTV
jgi:L-threonylcarbamoyladenylate synthase